MFDWENKRKVNYTINAIRHIPWSNLLVRWCVSIHSHQEMVHCNSRIAYPQTEVQ